MEVHGPSSPVPRVTGPPVHPAPPVVQPQPDESLPRKQFRAPTNWNPCPSVLSWGSVTLTEYEMSEEDRKYFKEKYSPLEEHDPIFTAPPFPADLRPWLSHSDVKKSDYLFNRKETEDFLFDAQEDLACGLRPLLDLLSSMRGVPDFEHSRTAHTCQKGCRIIMRNFCYKWMEMSPLNIEMLKISKSSEGF